MVAELQESFKDLRACALTKLQGYSENVSWLLPGGAKARVDPAILARIYRGGRSYESYLKEQCKQKGLDGNHLAAEWLMLAILIDRAVIEGSSGRVNLKSTEMAMRRLYGIERALELVHAEGDWRPPKGGSKGWRSKVQYHLLDDIDVGGIDKGGLGIEAVDKEVRDRLKEKALLAKSLGQLASVPARSEEL